MKMIEKHDIDKCIEVLENKQKELFNKDKDRYKNDMSYRCYINHMCSSIDDVIDLIAE